MQYKFFTISAMGADNAVATEELNVFLRSHRILTVQRELVNCGAPESRFRSLWKTRFFYSVRGNERIFSLTESSDFHGEKPLEHHFSVFPNFVKRCLPE